MALKNIAVSRDTAYSMTVNGLLPNTRHYLYVDSQRIPAEQIKPYGKLCGDPLVTDASGSITFEYFHITGAFEVATREMSNVVNKARIFKRRQYVVCNVNASFIDETTGTSARSYAKLYF